MEANDRLAEVKQFALRTVRERSKDKLLFKLISYGGSCNDVQTDVDWTRDVAVINAGIKGLYLRGGTPLGSALEYTIDNVKKSAYPDQTLILLLNDGANGCGGVQDILSRRIREIPCVRINVLGIELQDDENNLAERALADAEAISKATGGRFLPMNDVRELQGVSIADTGVAVRPVAFTPRKKVVKDSAAKTTAQGTNTQASPTTTATTSTESAPKKDTTQTLISTTRTEEKPRTEEKSRAEEKPRTEEKSRTEEKPQTTRNEAATTKENNKAQSIQETPPETSTKTTRSSKPAQTQQSSTSQAEQSSKTEQSKSSQNTTSEKQVAEKQSQKEKKSAKKQRLTQASSTKPLSEQAEPQRSTTPSQASVYVPSKDSTQSAGGATEEGIILFYTPNSAVLLPQMKQGLERLVERLKQSATPIQTIVVEGHSSIEGGSVANLRLSVERASGVAAFLQAQLRLPPGRITWNAFGEVRPVAPNTTEAGRQENRRVEVRVIRYAQRAQ